jgi:hypothetical protein
VRKEAGAVARMIERDSSREEVHEFYRDHAEFIVNVLRIPPDKAQAYCVRRADKLALPDSNSSIAELTAMALGGIQ